MAEYATIASKSVDCSGLPLKISMADLIEVIPWCEDEDRPGMFTIVVNGSVASLRTGKAWFWFSDPNVALEFKLRWV